MSGGKHFRNRHGGDGWAGGGVVKRESHGNAGIDPSVEGVSWGDARDGEQSQTHDIAPGAVTGISIAPEAVDGGVHIAGGSLSIDLFSSDVKPPHVVAALPSLPDDAYPVGDYAFLTTTSELYVNIADVWTLEDGTTITNGTMIGGLVRAGAVSADQISANAIETVHFQTTAQAPGVNNNPLDPPSGEVVIDSSGITIKNGKITLYDAAGASVLSGAGFDGAWTSFVAHGVYNASFVSGTASLDMPASIVGTAEGGDYATSLSTDLPMWVVSNSAGTLQRVTDVNAPSGVALAMSGGVTEVFQDVPVQPGMTYILARYAKTTASVGNTVQHDFIYQFADADHTLLGAAVTTSSAVVTTNSGGHPAYVNTADANGGAVVTTEAPATAAYLRVRMKVTTTGAGLFLVGRVSVEQGTLLTKELILRYNTSSYGSLFTYGAYQLALDGFDLRLIPDSDGISIGANTTDNAFARLGYSGLRFGAGGASATDVQLSRGAADRLDLASGDSLRIVSGGLQFGTSSTVSINGGYLQVNGLSLRSMMTGTTGGGAANLGSSALEVYQAGGAADSYMTFHHNGMYARHFGMDSATNDLFTGGWSAGATKQRIHHDGNSKRITNIYGGSVTVTITAGTTAGFTTVNFPGGTFSATPIVLVTQASIPGGTANIMAKSNSASSSSVNIYATIAAAPGGDISCQVHYLAIQYA